jgi:ferredoxin/flavodoxin
METVLIAYFSGTGGTAKAADALKAAFVRYSLAVDKQQIIRNKAIPNGEESLLVLLFAVHAANAPLPVHEWLETLTPVDGTPAVVISVSGGGEVFPNTACRGGSIRRLERKGYHVVYEQTIIMPSNMSVATPDFLAKRLLNVLSDRAAHIVDDVMGGMGRRVKPTALDRVIAALCLAEHKGAHHFGKQLSATDACNGCGWCARSCPGSNIRMDKGRPVFENSCVMCFSCAYGCPQHAVEVKRMSFLLNKDGFDIRRFEQLPELPEEKTGLLMAGVRRYLDGDDM